MNINNDIKKIISYFSNQIRNLQKIHSVSCINLLPKSVNVFRRTEKFTKNNKSYDLYGWKDDVLIDVYPTYKNIITKDDLPKSWVSYINEIIEVTNITKFALIVYNKHYNKYSNVIMFSNKQDIKIKTNHTITEEWVRATANKNFIMEDTINDILGKKRKRDYSNNNIMDDETTERLKMGHEFERDIIDKLISNHYLNFVKIAESYEAKDINKYVSTLIEMKRGTPFIYQGVLHNPNSKEYGCVDLLVRSDYINKLSNIVYPYFFTSGSKINNPHYVIVDIKWHKLHFNSDGVTLRNEGMMEVFKSQMCVYNNALGYMQGYLPNTAYILGRGWKKIKMEKKEIIVESSQDPFDKLGAIQFKERDTNILVKVEEGRKWLDELKKEEHDIYNPKYNHCYPNMNNNYDGTNKKRKIEIAEETNELTLIAHVSPKHRVIAKENNITSYLDPDINAEKLGIKGKTGELVDTLLENQKMTCAIKGKYQLPKVVNNEIYMDFEYMYCFETEENIPYLCGIGYVKNNKWNFEHVLLDNITYESRYDMCEKIINILDKISDKKRIFTWSGVDKKLLINLCTKYGLENKLGEIEWIDAYKFCTTNKINFRGARRYGLKEIGRVLKLNELTDLSWENNLSGSSSGVRKHYYKGEKWDSTNVIKYNEVDCKMVYEVIRNLRLINNI